MFILGAIVIIPTSTIFFACLLVYKYPNTRAGKFVKEYQQLVTGFAAMILATLTVVAVIEANAINKSQQNELERVGAITLSDALSELESEVLLVGFFKGDDAMQITIPKTLRDFEIIRTQSRETVVKISTVSKTVSNLNNYSIPKAFGMPRPYSQSRRDKVKLIIERINDARKHLSQIAGTYFEPLDFNDFEKFITK